MCMEYAWKILHKLATVVCRWWVLLWGNPYFSLCALWYYFHCFLPQTCITFSKFLVCY